MASLATIATIASLAGTAVSAVGTIAAGNAQAAQLQQQAVADRQEAEFVARQQEIRGNEELAIAQKQQDQYRRQKKLALSSLQARAAGSGFSATDPTALALADEIERYGTYQENLALYEGLSKRDNLRFQAGATRFSGASSAAARMSEASAARKGSLFGAAGTILGGISSMADRYDSQRVHTLPYDGRYGSWTTTVKYPKGYG